MKFLIFFLLAISPLCSYEHLGEGIYIERADKVSPELPRIAIVTVIIGGGPPSEEEDSSLLSYDQLFENLEEHSYDKIVQFGTRSKKLYAKKYGYDLIIATEKLDICYGHPALRKMECAWTKLALISRVLEQYDWVFLTDADSIILNFDCSLTSFIDDNYSIIACTEDIIHAKPSTYNPSYSYINTGQVFYRNSPITKQIIENAWVNHMPQTYMSYEQARVNKYIVDAGLFQHIKVHPPYDFNLWPLYYLPGDFIVHMYGYHGESLFTIFQQFEKQYHHILDQVEYELEQTNNQGAAL